MKSRCVSAMILVGILLVFASPGICQKKISSIDYTVTSGQSSINWSAGYIEAFGMGISPDSSLTKLNARSAALNMAKENALRSLMEILKIVQVDSSRKIEDIIIINNIARTQVDDLVKSAMIADQQYMPDGTAEVKLRMSLYKDLAQVIVPLVIDVKKEASPPEAVTPAAPSSEESSSQPPAAATPAAPSSDESSSQPPAAATAPAASSSDKSTAPPPAPPAAESKAVAAEKETTPSASSSSFLSRLKSLFSSSKSTGKTDYDESIIYTGVVIDARGIGAKAAILQKIYDEDGNTVYSIADCDDQCAGNYGMSGYTRNVTAAQRSPRLAGKPVTVKALKADGIGKADLVISKADAQKILNSVQKGSEIFKNCRVIIVLD